MFNALSRPDSGRLEMQDHERPVALALVTQSQLDMLGTSLKVVFRVGDGEEKFADLLRAFDHSRSVGQGNQESRC